jgi:nucleoside 2-deoxyribosyltransferase
VRVWEYSCPRCGGYYVSSLLYEGNRFTFDNGSFPLACVAFEWCLHHKALPNAKFVLTEEGKLPYSPYEAFPECKVFQLSEMQDAFPKGVELFERAMLNLARMVDHPLDRIAYDEERLPYALFTEPARWKCMRECLVKRGYVEGLGGTPSEAGLRITPEGWDKISQLEQPQEKAKSKQAFVAMWFTQEMDATYIAAIRPAILDAGYTDMCIKLKEHNNKICDEIVAEIRKSRFIVADFTGQRGGVYFEAGYGMGMGLPVIWLVRKDEVDKLHFDTRQYNHIVYDSSEDLRQKLYNRIAATIQ